MKLASTLRRLLVATGLLGCVSLAQANSFSNIVIFGDSLSDTGNLNLALGGTIGAPYFNGRISDGPVWVDYLAAQLGFTATPSLAGGNNYAFAGARTGTSGSPPGVLAQVGGIWAQANPVADPNALYVVVGGGNNMRDARDDFASNSETDQTGRQTAAQAAVNELNMAIGLLASRGARHILISNLPDLGATPEAAFKGLAAASSDATARFNALVPGMETFWDAAGLDVDLLDMAGVAAQVRANPAQYGFTNVMFPCNGFPGSPNQPQTACATSLFSDALHPTTAAHKLIGDAAFLAVQDPIAAVPEPETYALMAMGLALLAWRARRRS